MATTSQGLNQQDNFADPIPEFGNGQWNLLIIAVDQLASSHPSLMGLWLLITFPDNQNLTLVPIYPVGDLNLSPENTVWEKDFSLNSAHKPNEDFLEKVSEQIKWDDYLMLDKEGMSIIIEKFADIDLMPQAIIDLVDTDILPKTGMDIELSLDGQVEIWRAICLKLSNITEPNDFTHLLNQINPHIHAKFDLDEITRHRYLQEKTALQLTCEFPTLTLNSP